METKHTNAWDWCLDSEGDMVGIVPDKPVICGNCLVKMIELTKNNFSCPKCSNKYKIDGL